jgi:hypothetical protein
MSRLVLKQPPAHLRLFVLVLLRLLSAPHLVCPAQRLRLTDDAVVEYVGPSLLDYRESRMGLVYAKSYVVNKNRALQFPVVSRPISPGTNVVIGATSSSRSTASARPARPARQPALARRTDTLRPFAYEFRLSIGATRIEAFTIEELCFDLRLRISHKLGRLSTWNWQDGHRAPRSGRESDRRSNKTEGDLTRGHPGTPSRPRKGLPPIGTQHRLAGVLNWHSAVGAWRTIGWLHDGL